MTNTHNKLHNNLEAVENIRNLRSIRINLGMSVSALAFSAGLCINTIRDLENGIHLPSARSYNKLAQIFNWQKLYGIPNEGPIKEPNYVAIPELLNH